MASLQSRLSSLITAIGADIKALQALTPTKLTAPSSLSDSSEPTKTVAWYYLGTTLIGKLAIFNPTISAAIRDRTELWVRLKSRTGGVTLDRVLLDSDGMSYIFAPMVTALPTQGQSEGALMDGQECFFDTGVDGVVWHLKYSTTSGKWHFIGGASLFDNINTTETRTNAAYGTLTTSGPNVNLPLAGDYHVEIGCEINGTAATWLGKMSYQIGATAAADADRVIEYDSGAYGGASVQRAIRKAGLGAVQLSARYATDGATVSFRNRWMRVTPIQVS